MLNRVERAAFERLIPKLRPFFLEGDERFVLPDGTELRVAYISRATYCGEHCGKVAVLCRAGSLRSQPPSGSVNCAGVVLLRVETDEERESRCQEPGFCASYVVEGLATEARDEQGRRTVYLVGCETTFPALIT